MNIDLGNIIVKKVTDEETNLVYFIFFETGNFLRPIMILEQYLVERLAKNLNTQEEE